jgi:hypothetical protein
VPASVWGGDPDCRHRRGQMQCSRRKDMLPTELTKRRARREWHPLDAARMCAGSGRAAQHFGQPIDVFHEQHDVGEADVAFQYAILGGIVYG